MKHFILLFAALSAVVLCGCGPSITTQPQSVTKRLGEAAVFHVVASGSSLTYQWERVANGAYVFLNDGDEGTISGAKSDTLTISAVGPNDGTTYLVSVSDGNGSTPSSIVDLNIPATITTGPVNQTIDYYQDPRSPDNVMFAVTAVGWPAPSYQWTFTDSHNTTTAIQGATGASLSLPNPSSDAAGTYAVVVQNSFGRDSAAATLTVNSGTPYAVELTGTRSDFTFKNNTTYWVQQGTTVTLTGTTTIEGGAVIKYAQGASIVIQGDINCQTATYRPAILTAESDDTVGGYQWQVPSHPDPYAQYYAAVALDIQSTKPTLLHDLRICHASTAIRYSGAISAEVTDTVRHLQLLHCGTTFRSVGNSASPRQPRFLDLGNVLISGASTAISGSYFLGRAQHLAVHNCGTLVSDDLANGYGFYYTFINCIVANVTSLGQGLNLSASSNNGFYSAQSFGTAQFTSPAPGPFQAADSGHYYLAATSGFQGHGTIYGVSSALLNDLKTRTTSPPLSLPGEMPLSGQVTLSAQTPRYVTGSPDLGYYYPALDATISDLSLSVGASLTVLPGTAIAVRPEGDGYGAYLYPFSRITGHGTPNNPITFADLCYIQEGPFWTYVGGPPSLTLLMPVGGPYPGIDPDYSDNQGPILDFRFCNFVVGPADFHLASGEGVFLFGAEYIDANFTYYCPSMFITLRDCSFFGGNFSLGEPDPGSWSVTFAPGSLTMFDNLFDSVNINLDPTLYPYGDLVNSDMPVSAYNNLFHGGSLRLEPNPTSAGNWVFRDNLFDTVIIIQDTLMPLDHDHNGYWEPVPLYPDVPGQVLRLGPDSGGTVNLASDQVLPSAPAYQNGIFGGYYLPTSQPLYSAGSSSPADAGLFHYTTRLDQVKEGEESSGHMVNIGVHYVATASAGSLAPRDTDGDGIPDYLEDWNGNGRQDLGEGDPAVPQTDTLQITGVSASAGDADVYVSAKAPDTLTSLTLKANGLSVASLKPVSWPLCLTLDTRTIPNGECVLQVEGSYSQANQETFPDSGYVTAQSASVTVQVDNQVSYPEWKRFAGRDGYVFKINAPGTLTSWTIQIFDASSGATVRTLSGTTAAQLQGAIWDLRDNQGNLRNDGAFASTTSINGPGGNVTFQNPRFSIDAYPDEGKWTCAYQDIIKYDYDKDGSFATALNLWLAFPNQVGGGALFLLPEPPVTVQTWPVRYKQLIPPVPQGGWDDPGPLARLYDEDSVAYYLADARSRNFFYFGHGNPNFLFGGEGGLAYTASDLAKQISRRYRLAFLYGCQTAAPGGSLAGAFGIDDAEGASIDEYEAFPSYRPAAFLGCDVNMPFRHPEFDVQVNGQPYLHKLSQETAFFLQDLMFFWGPPPLLNQGLADAIVHAKQGLPDDGLQRPIYDQNGQRVGTEHFRAGDHLRIFGYPDLRFNDYNQANLVFPP